MQKTCSLLQTTAHLIYNILFGKSHVGKTKGFFLQAKEEEAAWYSEAPQAAPTVAEWYRAVIV